MCGLAGYLALRDDRNRAPLGRIAGAMARKLVHRGPDDEGIWVDEAAGAALSHRRLSVVDLSPEGHQPMTSRSGRFVLVFNGEIYNYKSIRAELERAGESFRGTSDTEVMLAGFERWGYETTLDALNGMFAIALWDRSERRLHLARDRMGEKPLYYGVAHGAFAFASELKALRALGWVLETDAVAVAEYMRYGYVPAPRTIYRGISKLPPACTLTVSGTGPLPTPREYWSLRDAAIHAGAQPLSSRAELLECTHALAKEAVGLRMHADVPLGAFLSGGIDSSTVVALMQAQSSRPVRTFTIGFRETGYDEAVHAGAIARHLGTDHTELYLTPQDALDVVPLLPEMYDEPFADPSAIPTYLVSKLARSQVTVALSGDGGDELFGGYDRYHHTAALWRLTRRIPRPLRRGLAAELRPGIGLALERLLHPARSLLPAVMRKDLAQKLSRTADFVRRDSALEAYRSLMSLWDMGSEEVEAGAAFGEHALPDDRTLVEQLMYVDALTYLPDDILVKLDRASMAVSLEFRVPFLDHRFVELSWRIPIELKTVEGSTKWPLRQVLFEHVPRELVERPKQGFAVPIGAWLRGPLKGWALDVLQGERVRQTTLLDEPRVARWLDEHLTGTRNWEHHLWRALMLLAWHQESRPVLNGEKGPVPDVG